MKKVFVLFLVLCLFACNESSSNSMSNNILSEDLKILLNNSPSNHNDELPFNTEASLTPSTQNAGYYIVSVAISYKETIINDICIIAVPDTYTLLSAPSNVASVGYDEKCYSLTPNTDVEKYQFFGFRISYLVDNNNDGVKVFVKAKEISQLMYSIPNNEIERR